MATYYIDVATGDDTTGDGSSGNPWKTLTKAADMVNDGDKVWVKASGNYETEDGTNDCVMYCDDQADDESPIVFEGYHTSTGDGGIVTVNADPAGDQFSYCIRTDAVAAGLQWVFKNFYFTGASSHAIYGNAATDGVFFYNCRFSNNGGNATLLDNYCAFINCMFDNNTGGGPNADSYVALVCCVAFNNGSYGFDLDLNANAFVHCLSFNNTNGLCFDSGYYSTFVNCTADGEGDALADGIRNVTTQGSPFFVVNSILYDCNDGIQAIADKAESGIGFFNYFNSNTSKVTQFTDVSTGDGYGNRGDTTSSELEASLFEDAGNVVDLSRDYTPASGSDAIGAGMDASFTMAFWKSFNDGNNPPTA